MRVLQRRSAAVSSSRPNEVAATSRRIRRFQLATKTCPNSVAPAPPGGGKPETPPLPPLSQIVLSQTATTERTGDEPKNVRRVANASNELSR